MKLHNYSTYRVRILNKILVCSFLLIFFVDVDTVALCKKILFHFVIRPLAFHLFMIKRQKSSR